MATAPETEIKGPQLQAMEIIGDGKEVQVDYRSARGKQRRAVFAANDDVARALETWSEQQRLKPPDRSVLNDNAVRGWPKPRNTKKKAEGKKSGDGSGGKQKKKITAKDLKNYKAPKIPPKEARLAEEAKAIAAYRKKDDYLVYWAIIALVSVISMMLLGL